MRAAHSLKGAARIVGLDAAVRVAHAMEDGFVAAQKGKLVLRPEHVDILLRGVDLLVQIAQLAEAELPPGRRTTPPRSTPSSPSWTAVKEGRVEARTAVADVDAGPVPSRPRSRTRRLRRSEPTMPADLGTPAPADRPEGPIDEPDRPRPPARPRPRRATRQLRATGRDRDRDRVVRVTAESLTRLMGLAGEALVQSHRLRPLVDALWRLGSGRSRLMETLQVLEDRLADRRGRTPGRRDGRSAAGHELLAKARAGPPRACRAWPRRSRRIETFARASEDLSSRLHHEVLASRMRPLADGIRGFPRLVRDLARELGKEARFEVDGETTGVDRDILDKLEAPLNHLIRNALDHGIEPPEERRAAGKPPAGDRSAWRPATAPGCSRSSSTDDGRGVDLERLRAKVVERGLATAAMARRLGEAELLEFLFLPGFSTKEQVTEISGRGVGLDVVQSMVHAVARLGPRRQPARQGDAVHPPVADHRLGHPRPAGRDRRRALRLPPEPDRPHPDGRPRRGPRPRGQAARPAGRPARRPGRRDPRARARPSGRPTRAGEPCRWWSPATAAIASAWWSTAFLGERDLRVSPLDPRLGKVPNISSSSVLEDGWPVLIVDVEDLVRSVDNLLSRPAARQARRRGSAAAPAPAPPSGSWSWTTRSPSASWSGSCSRAGATSSTSPSTASTAGTPSAPAIIDLVVSDIDMPRMDGIQLVRQIKDDARLQVDPGRRRLVQGPRGGPDQGLDAGANAYLTKSSFHDQTFLDTVADLIGEARE